MNHSFTLDFSLLDFIGIINTPSAASDTHTTTFTGRSEEGPHHPFLIQQDEEVRGGGGA